MFSSLFLLCKHYCLHVSNSDAIRFDIGHV